MPHRLRVVVLATLFSLGPIAEAVAHAHLQTATPAKDGTVAAPSELSLVFSEGVNPTFSGVTVTGPGGAPATTGVARLGPGGDRTLVVPVSGRLAPGRYAVEWHALATDGHKTAGSYTFSVAP